MAQKRTRRKSTRNRHSQPRRRARRRQEPPPEPREPLLSPETARLVTAIGLLAGSVILLLALVGLGGPAGSALALWVKQAIGAAAWVVPPAAAYAGWRLYQKDELPRHVIVGFFISLAAVTGLLHLLVKVDEQQAAVDGTFGGLLGYALTSTVGYAVGGLVSLIIFVVLFVIGLLVMINRKKDSDPDITKAEPPPRQKEVSPAPAPPPDPKRAKDTTPPPAFTPRVVDSAWEQPPRLHTPSSGLRLGAAPDIPALGRKLGGRRR
jgi:hypothetical protein